MTVVLNLSEFNKRIRKAVDNQERGVKKFQGLLFEETATRVLKNTRVDTGQARHNWNMSVSQPDLTTTAAVAGVRSRGAPLTTLERSKIYAVRAIIDANPVGSVRAWIANALPYIRKLDRLDGIIAVSSFSALEAVKSRLKFNL